MIIDPADLELDPSSQAVVQQNKVAARNLAVLQDWAARPLSGASRRISFHFWSRPTKIIGNDRVTAVEVERTMIDSEGFVVGAGPPSHVDRRSRGAFGRLSRPAAAGYSLRREDRTSATCRRPSDP